MNNNYTNLNSSDTTGFKNSLKEKFLFLLFMVLFSVLGVQAQISVSVDNPTNTSPNLLATYPNLAAALTDVNLVTSMTGPITLTLTGSETAPPTGLTIGSATLNPVLSATNTITLLASGTVTINAGVGTATPASAAPDGILKLLGADYVTLNGITFTDGNAANPATMEYGVGLFKRAAGDGCNNNTIVNCIFNMQRINNVTGTAPMVEGAVGILVINSTSTAATTSLTPTNGGTLATNGTNSGNKFYTNTINGGNYGIVFSGFAASSGVGPTPTATTFLGDLGNDVGGNALSNGNTILNFGGVAASTNPSAGIRANNQWSINIQYNTVNNNNGSGVNHVTTLRGIYAQAGTSANATISNNNVTIQSGATTSTVSAIENVIGSTAASNTIDVNSNTIRIAYSTATTGVMNGILNSSTATTVNINSNNIQGVTSTFLSGTGTHVAIETGSPVTVNTNSNTVSNISRNGASGSWRGIKTTSPTNWNASLNTIEGLSWTAAASTGSLDAFYSFSSAVNVTISNNIIRNLSTPTTGTITGINEFGSSGLKTFQNNQIYNFSSTAGGVGGATFRGISESTGSTNTFSGNQIYSLNSTGSTGGTAGTIVGITISSGTANNVFNNKIYDLSSTSTGPTVSGLTISGGTTNTLYNNIIGDLRTPAANSANPLIGINITGGTTDNVYYNTVYLAGASTGALFGSSAISVSTTPTVTLRNNIFVNNSSFNGAAFAVAYRRSSTTLTSYGASSNNNLFYAASPAQIYSDAATAKDFPTYKTYVGPTRDAASISNLPSFLSTIGSAATFLHIDPSIATLIESGGATIATFTTDFDGDTRNASTPDIGADEFSGSSPAPALTGLTVPTSACVATSHAVSVTATTPSGTISGVVLNFSFNGTAQSPINMTNTSGNLWEATIPVASPTTATVTWTVTATNTGLLSTSATGTSYADEPSIPIVTATATPTTVCSGGNSQLLATAVQAFTTPSVSTYGFATSTGATLDPMAGATTVISASTDDAPMNTSLGANSTAGASVALPFTFNFNGTAYTFFSASPDGFVTLTNSNAAIASQFTNAVTSTTNIPKLYPYWDDLATGTDGWVKTVTTGTAPNRIFVVEWKVTIPRNTTGASNSTFQLWMYETSNKVEFRYGTMGAQTSNSISAGLTGSGSAFQSLTFSTNTSSNATANDVIATVPASGRMYTYTPAGAPTFVYTWTPATFIAGQTALANPVATAVTATQTYSVSVTGNGPCPSVPATVTVTVNPLTCTAATVTSPLCQGTNFTVTAHPAGGGAPYHYAWSDGAGGVYPDSASITANKAAGDYTFTCTVTDSCSPTASCDSSVVVHVNGLPTVNVAPTTGLICLPGGVAVPLTASGNATSYSWSPSAGLDVSTGTNVSANPTVTTPYVVTGTDANGCTSTATSTISVGNAVVLTSVVASSPTVCSGGNTNLTANVAGPTSYCTSTHTSGCSGDNVTNVTLGSINNSTGSGCGGTSHYTYFNPSTATTTTTLTPGSSTITLSFGTDSSQFFGAWIDYNQDGVFAASEFLGASGNAGASGTTSVIFTVPGSAYNGATRLRVVGGNDSAVTATQACGASSSPWGETQDYNVTISGATNAYTYLWSEDGVGTTLTSTSTNPTSATNITATKVYTVTATAPSGCNATGNTTVTVAPFSCSAATVSAVRCAGGNFTVTANSTGGGAPYHYVWSDGVGGVYPDSATVTANLPAGSYTFSCIVTDSCLQTCTSSVPVTVNALPTITASPSTGLYCSPGAAVTINAGGAGAGTYAWSPALGLSATTGSSVDANPAANTVYTVTGTDGNGCVSTATSTISVGGAVTMNSVTASNTSICGSGNTTLTANATTAASTSYCASTHASACLGDNIERVVLNTLDKTTGTTCGTTSSAYSDFTALTGANTTTLTASTLYTVNLTFGTDANQYFGAWIDYNKDGSFAASEFLGASGNAGASGTIGVSFTVPAGAYNGTTRLRIVGGNDSAVTATQACGASSSGFGETQDYTLTIVGGVDPITYAWSETGVGTTLTSTSTNPTSATGISSNKTYNVTATAASGCYATGSVNVTISPLPVYTINNSVVTICKGSPASLEVNNPSGSYNYSWTLTGDSNVLGTTNPFSVSPLANTVYDVTVTTNNAVACSTTSQVTVNVTNGGIIESQPTNAIAAIGFGTTYTVAGTTGITYSYQWQVKIGAGSFTNVSGANYPNGGNLATLTIANSGTGTAVNNALYRCLLTPPAPCTALISSSALLTVSTTGITAGPQNLSVCLPPVPASLQFNITTSGDEPYSVQWSYSTNGITPYVDIPLWDLDNEVYIGPATVGGMTFSHPLVAGEYNQKVIIITGVNSSSFNGYKFKAFVNEALPTSIATLTVSDQVSISSNLSTAEVKRCKNQVAPQTATNLSITTSGTVGSVEWRYSTTPGVTNSSPLVTTTPPTGVTHVVSSSGNVYSLAVTTTSAASAATYYYKAFVAGTGNCNAITSNEAIITVVNPTVAITASSTAYCTPSTGVTLTATTGLNSYAWSSLPAGYSNATNTASLLQPSVATTYTVIGTDINGCTNTASQAITVGTAFTASATASLSTVCPDSSVTLNGTASLPNPVYSGLANTYAFATSTGATLDPMVGATTLIGTGNDDTPVAGFALPFPFNFNGVNYNFFSASPDGFIRLDNAGATASSQFTNAVTSTTNIPKIYPYWDDLATGTTGSVQTVTTGVSPNRIVKVQWFVTMPRATGGPANSTFQLWMYETTNKIEFRYGTMGLTTSSSGGLTGSGTSFQSLTFSTNTVSTTTANNANNFTLTSGRMYSFTPPVVDANIYTYSWAASPSASIANGSTTTASPAANTTYTLTATSQFGCSAVAAPVTVNVASTPPTVQPLAASLAVCQGQPATLSVTATNIVPISYVWKKGGVAIVPAATGATYTIPAAAVADSGSYTVDVTSCTTTVPSTATVLTVNPLPTATIAASSNSVCQNDIVSPTVTFTGAAGTAPYTFTYSLNGAPDTTITSVGNSAIITIPTASASNNAYTLKSVTDSSSTACVNVQTGSATVTVNPLPTAPVLTPVAPICAGSTLNLNATVVPQTNVPVLSQNFESGIGSWVITAASSGGTTPAVANFTIRNHGYTSGTTFNSPGGNSFILADPDNAGSGIAMNTQLTSPSFSTVGFTALSLSFRHYHRFLTTAPTVEVSTNNGSTWTSIASYTADQGTATSFVTATVSMNAYVGLPNVKIRYNFTGGWLWYWAIDDIAITGDAPNYGYAWSGPNGFTSPVQNPSIANATTAATGDYTLEITNLKGCKSSSTVSATVNPTPTATAPANQVYYNNVPVAAIPLSGTPSGVLFDISVVGNVGLNATYTGVFAVPAFTPTTGSATVNITPKANGCTGATVSYTINVSTINADPVANQVYCAGITTNAIALTATPVLLGVTFNITGGASVGLADQFGITAIPAFITTPGTATITVTPIYQTVPGVSVTATITVNPLPTATVSGTIGVCQNAPQPLITFTGANGTAPYTFTYKLTGVVGDLTVTTVSGNSVTVSAPTGTAGIFTYSLLSVQDSSSTTCSQAQGGAATVTVYPTTVGGTVSGGTSPICTGFAPGTLTLSGHTGSVLQWESTTDNLNWFPIANTANTYAPGILTITTTFRAVVQSGACLIAYSTPRTITVYQQYPFYADNDHDGYGAGPVVSLCSVNGATAPAGYSVDGTDCDDTKSDRHQTYPFYVDQDGDGYGKSGSTPVQLCAKNAATPPLPNYSVNNGDCNDLVAAIRPGAVEIQFDNIDNNCDGSLTDGGPLVVLNMTSNECGQENFKIEKELKCTKIDLNGRTHGNGLPPGMVVGYRFEITNESTGQVEYVDSSNEKVRLIETNIYNFNTWYTIRAGAIINGEFQGFNGTSCHVKTEDAGTSKVKNGQCGTTLNAMNTKINAENLKDGKTYRFRIALASAPGVFYYYENDKPDFKLTDVPGLPLTYQTEYLVDVQVLVKIRPEIQAWTVYGAVCSIFTPAFPETYIKTAECDYFETHATASNTVVHAQPFPGATMYRFLLTGYDLLTGDINYQQTLDRAVPDFTLSMFNALSPLSPNTTYTIAVSMQLYGSWVPYGKDCAITTTANPREGAIKDDNAFKAAAYPNPFADNFMIEVKTISNAIVNLKVYDMVGRLVEERSVNVPELGNSPIGDRYPSGVYNVVITQGDDVKTVRVVKR